MNQRLPEMPHLGSEVYAPTMPVWLTNLLRLFSLVFALFVAWLGFHDWSKMPLWVLVIVCIIPPLFLMAAFSAKGWAQYSSRPFFLADYHGMYFKHKEALITHVGKDAPIINEHRKNWLFVPWKNISNIRVSKIFTHHGSTSAAMFDVKATEDELADFLGRPIVADQLLQEGRVAVAFYMNILPAPSTVVDTLQAMLSRFKQSPLRKKYAHAR